MSYSLEANYCFEKDGVGGSYQMDCLTKNDVVMKMEKVKDACVFLGISVENLTFHVVYTDKDEDYTISFDSKVTDVRQVPEGTTTNSGESSCIS